MYHYKGWRWFLEGFYMWLGKRLPAGLVYRASSRMLEYADQQGLQPHEIAGFMEVQSLWLTDKMP